MPAPTLHTCKYILHQQIRLIAKFVYRLENRFIFSKLQTLEPLKIKKQYHKKYRGDDDKAHHMETEKLFWYWDWKSRVLMFFTSGKHSTILGQTHFEIMMFLL